MTTAARTPRTSGTTHAAGPEVGVTFRSMASDVRIRVIGPGPGAESAVARAADRIHAAARHLTRFAPSALTRTNDAPGAWHLVPAELADALAEAHRAHRETGGLFDPRVLGALLAWGYDRTFTELRPGPADLPELAPSVAAPSTEPAVPPSSVRTAAPSLAPAVASSPSSATPPSAASAGVLAHPTAGSPWSPVVLPGSGDRLVHLDGVPVDLGGIGKGLAVRWAAAELAGSGTAVLVDAGGDEWLGGAGPDGDGWLVGVEDPSGGDDPLLVLRLEDVGVATSSIRRRTWRTGGAAVHHLVDPRTGLPGGGGLAQVTVLHDDPAWAEVWSKTLFLTGHREVAAQAEVRGLAAAWVTADGRVRVSDAMAPLVVWRSR